MNSTTRITTFNKGDVRKLKGRDNFYGNFRFHKKVPLGN